MPSLKNWVNFLYINIAFVIYITAVLYYSQVSEIKANWPLYRCNPIYMFLADDIEENLTYCVKSTDSNFIRHLLQPVTFVTGIFITIIGSLVGDTQTVRAIFNKITKLLYSSIESLFDMFLNLASELKQTHLEIKDLLGKSTGIMTSQFRIMNGNINNEWKGQNITSLGKCFHPDTKIKLQSGEIKCIKDIDLGDILEDGSVVESTMKIDNKKDQIPLYKIKEAGVNKEDIYVTGSHMVYDSSTKLFIPVQTYSKSEISRDIHSDWFSCLITNSHNIKIGAEIFWDWEDYCFKLTLY
jgi:hypothetical protein